MQKATLLAAMLILTGVSTHRADAQSVTTGAIAGSPVPGLGDSAGADLAIGSLIRIGRFTISDAAVMAIVSANLTQDAIALLEPNWLTFDTSSVGTGIIPASPAHWADVTDVVSGPSYDADFLGQRINLWVFNAATTGTATEHGIFSSTDVDWTFPARLPVPGSATTDLSDVDLILAGGFGVGTSDLSGGPLYNTVVPEPSTYATIFGLLCLGGAILRRKLEHAKAAAV
jgi:hypothetical protein